MWYMIDIPTVLDGVLFVEDTGASKNMEGRSVSYIMYIVMHINMSV